MLGIIGNNPLCYLNGRRVCIADRLRAYQYKLMHYKGADKSVQQEVPPSGVQMDLRGTDCLELEEYLAHLVLITSVSKHCICSTAGASNGCHHAARDVATPTHSGGARRAVKGAGEGAGKGEGEGERLCQHWAANFVMALDIVPGLHYDPTCVVELSDTHGFGLTAAPLAKALPLFCNLRRLNLSRNRIATLCGLGLEGMVHLQVLDVSSNAVRDRIRNLGATLDALPRLVALMLRNNPCMRTRAERMRLMQAMTSLGDVSCSLRYIDTAITMAERVQAWAQASARSPVQLEMLKQKALLNLSTPPETALSSLVELDLSSRSLRALHGELLTPLVRLRRLMLQDNNLTSLVAAQLYRLTSLQALDLRRNALTDADDVLQMAISLSNLQELGVGGNPWRPLSQISIPEPFTGQADEEGGSEGDEGEASARGGSSAARGPDMHRLLLAALSGRYSQDPHYPLRFIDDEQIAIPHIVRACGGGAQAAGSKLAFDLTVARQMQDCVSLGVLAHDARIHELRQLDLSNRELSWVDFSRMPMLTQLFLQHNHLSDEALAAGALLQITCLQHIDLSFNRIESASLVGEIVAAGHKSRSLLSITISHNPCFPSTNLYEHRVGFLAAMSVVASVGAAGATLSLLNDAHISVEERVDAVERFLRSPEGGQAAGSQPQASSWVPSVLCSQLSGTQSQQQQFAKASDEDRIAGAVEGVRLTLLLEQRRYSYSSASLSLAHKRLACLLALRDYTFLSVLDVRGNELRCLDPLASLPRLRRLDVRDNKVALPAACLALAASASLALRAYRCKSDC